MPKEITRNVLFASEKLEAFTVVVMVGAPAKSSDNFGHCAP
jgi:hypothetical protein